MGGLVPTGDGIDSVFHHSSPGPSHSSSVKVHGLTAFLLRLEVRNSYEAIKKQSVHVWHVQLDNINP